MYICLNRGNAYLRMKTFRTGEHINQGTYKSFEPNFINRQWKVEDMELIDLLSQADRQLGRLDMYSEYIPNIDIFISMHVVKEATKSSKIEGTQTNMEEALLGKEDIDVEKRDDWEEVQNYILALNEAVESLSNLPFSSRLIRQIHKTLLQGVRGEHKLPGEFRSSQNWIGGSSISDALFIPPIHTSVSSLMGDLENFVHNESVLLPHLLRIALVHYQFETIHPFLDGNGRVGRSLITLYLVEKKILKKPILYLSEFFESNRLLYYDNLMRARNNNDLTQWFKFFLVGVIETAKNGINTFDQILKLKEEVDGKLQKITGGVIAAQKLMTHLYQRPIVVPSEVADITGVSSPTAYKLLSELESLNILKEMSGSKRGKVYFFKRYFDIFN